MRKSVAALLAVPLALSVSLGLAACNGTTDASHTEEAVTEENPDKAALTSAIQEDMKAAGDTYQCVNVYTNDDYSIGAIAAIDGSFLEVKRYDKDDDGSFSHRSTGAYTIPQSLHYNSGLTESLEQPSIKEFLGVMTEVAYSSFVSSLYDPDAAKFSDISVVYYTPNGYEDATGEEPESYEETPIIRLVANGKNRFGGYTGAQEFYYCFDGGELYGAGEDDYKFSEMKEQFENCREGFEFTYYSFEPSDFE